MIDFVVVLTYILTIEDKRTEHKFCLLSLLLDGKDSTVYPAGNSVYPFQYKLPADLPSSFAGKYGTITYEFKCVIKRPRRFDHRTEQSIDVRGRHDLNQVPDAHVNTLFLYHHNSSKIFSYPVDHFSGWSNHGKMYHVEEKQYRLIFISPTNIYMSNTRLYA